MYARIFKIVKGGLRPAMELALYRGTAGIDGTDLISAKLFVQHRSDETMLINGAVMTITDIGPPAVLLYDWVPADTAAASSFNMWAMLYWGGASTIGEYVTCPELLIFEPGSELTF